MSKDDILPTKDDEMGGYDVIPFALKPSEERQKELMVNDNYALLKDVSTASPEMETQIDYTYATVDKKKGGSGNDIISMSLSVAEDHLPQRSLQWRKLRKKKRQPPHQRQQWTSCMLKWTRRSRRVRRRRCVLRSQGQCTL